MPPQWGTAVPDRGELALLTRYLDAQRAHVLNRLDGLDERALRTASLPSGWTPLGLVQHLTVDVERFWFQAVLTAEPEAVAGVLATGEGGSSAWQVPEDVAAEQVLSAYRRECERANAVLRAAQPDDGPRWWPQEAFGDWRLDTVRETVLHVLVETATHAGHLDAARELTDGAQWLVLT